MSLNLRVSKQDFLDRIEKINNKMINLDGVIQKYRTLKSNLDQFVQPEDSTYEQWCQRIDANIESCGRAKAALKESKDSMQKTVDQMENIGAELRETISAATEATKSTAEAAIRIAPLL